MTEFDIRYVSYEVITTLFSMKTRYASEYIGCKEAGYWRKDPAG